MTSASFTLGGVTDQTITYTYDTGTNQKGRLTGASDANHTLAWTYDTQGRVTGKGQTVGGVTLVDGLRLQRRRPAREHRAALGRDHRLRLQRERPGDEPHAQRLDHDPERHHLRSVRSHHRAGPGATAPPPSRAFDTDGKITQVDNANGASLKNYGYDDAFRITGITDAGDSALSWTYGYDTLDRLNAATQDRHHARAGPTTPTATGSRRPARRRARTRTRAPAIA